MDDAVAGSGADAHGEPNGERALRARFGALSERLFKLHASMGRVVELIEAIGDRSVEIGDALLALEACDTPEPGESDRLRGDALRIRTDFADALTITQRDLRVADELLGELKDIRTGDYLTIELARQSLIQEIAHLRGLLRTGVSGLTGAQDLLEQALTMMNEETSPN